jgi:hypothetical protein
MITAIALTLAAYRAIPQENVIESWIPMLREPLLAVAAGPDEAKDRLFSGRKEFDLGNQHVEHAVQVWLFAIGGKEASLEIWMSSGQEGQEQGAWSCAGGAPNDGRF